ncbi:MAG: nucleotidyltransferase domain-containing protein [Nanoarchaeota archaeon]
MLGEVKFVHSVSKGSKFNQIYIPKDMESVFEAGDMVEVRLIEKKDRIFYSKNLKDLSEFKRKIVEKVFSILGRLKEVERIFLFGSFLTSKNEYHDIDVLVISDKKLIDSKVYDILNEEFDMKFHIISIQKNKFEQLLKICPLMRSMMFYTISNERIEDLPEREIDKKYLKFLLMLPEDLLEIKLNSRVFYEVLRRLIAIEEFISKGQIDPVKIDFSLNKEIGEVLLTKIKENSLIGARGIVEARKFIKIKLNKINSFLKNE